METLNIDIDGFSDHLDAELEREHVRITCASDWAGDTETGFGESVGIPLNREQATVLRDWLSAAILAMEQGA